MAFNFLSSARVSAAAIAVSTLVAACGGGGAEADATSTASDASSGTAATTSTVTSTDTSSAVASTTTSSADAAATVESASATAAATSGLVSVGSGDSGLTSGTSSTVVTTASGSSGTTLTTTSTATALAKRSSVALNLGAVSYYSPEVPTIDVMKRAGNWLTQCSTTCGTLPAGAGSWDTKEEAALDLDANGWIKSLPAANDSTNHYRFVSTMLSASGALPLGRYIVRYDGTGTITYSGFTKNSSSTAGRDVVDLTTTGNAWMTITATSSTDYIRNIRVYLPGGACANDLTTYAASATACTATTGAYVPFESFPSTQIWNPQFLQDVKGFRALRFMDWSLTNSTAIATWDARTLPTTRVWTGGSGVPVEAMLDLANAVGADAWLNVPPYADDNYALQMGKLAATHLTNGVSKVDLEYSNEPWNYAFPAANWMLAQAKAKWPALVSAGTNVYGLQTSWYGERLSQVCTAAKSGSSLVRCIMNSQAANANIAQQMLGCPYAVAELGHTCAKDVDALAIAPYFGGYISMSKLRSVIATWYTDSDGGLTKLFSEITGTDANGNPIAGLLSAAGSGAPNGALALSKSWMVANKAVADSYGVPMWAYEGGQHLLLAAGDTDMTLQSLFLAANRDPRMGAAYDRMISDWTSSGGQAFSYYSHIAQPSVYGIWGLKETMTDSSNPKWLSAVKNRDAKSCNWTGC